jgi:hypothetical protein
MSTNINDTKVKQFREAVNAFREKIGKRPRISYTTNGILTLDGGKFNLNLLNSISACVDVTSQIISKNDTYVLACEVLGVPVKEAPLYSGYTIDDWIGDIKQRVELIQWDIEKSKLDAMDKKLSKLMSEEARTANELDLIAKELGLDD